LSDVQQNDDAPKSENSVEKDFVDFAGDNENDLQDLDGNFEVNGEDDIFETELDRDDPQVRATIAVEHLVADNEESKNFVKDVVQKVNNQAESHLEGEKGFVKLAPAKKVKINEAKVDAELIKSIWPYMRPDDDFISDSKIAENGVEIMQDLHDDLDIAIAKNMAKITSINNDFPNAEHEEVTTTFELSDQCT
jgi:hypothetical protein